MKKLQLLFLFSLLLTINHFGWAQSNGRISGKIVDKFTQKPIEGVNVNLESTNKIGQTDSLGKFRITGINFKSYNLVLSMIGYKKWLPLLLSVN